MATYYNEFDPYAAQWLRNLIAAGHIPAGDVDERPIQQVQAADLAPYTQAHFFAGLGGWAYAARLAGWPDDRPIWTGSCPCQPFSAAGKGGGFDDERHLWPDFFRLIAECRPAIVFGEQVASPAGLAWLDLVSADLERAHYAVAAADTGAASVGAPHIRQRLWWVADSDIARPQGWCGVPERADQRATWPDGLARGLGFPDRAGSQPRELATAHMGLGRSADAAGRAGHWRELEWLPCTDGKARPTRPGLFPLAHGVSARVGKLRAAGNAIVPQVAAEFIGAVMDAGAA